ncbi:MAG: hypothetical protein E3J35_06380 [Methanomassiliicoccales archaeon]|nr:MAG: hypothetical protein E3J35_06380 [Methanomassiliicoccales archaeon]
MRLNRDKPIDKIELRYVIIHSLSTLEIRLKEVFGEVALDSYDIQNIEGIFQVDVVSATRADQELSRVEIQVLDMPYQSIMDFEDVIISDGSILEVCKTYDSFTIQENSEFLAELYGIEMKIREIYTVLARLQGVHLENSKARLYKNYRQEEETFRKRLINEFFFISFSGYKDVDRRKDANLTDLVESLRQAERIEDISNAALELSHPTLHLEERFNELSRVPEAIGRLENLRNNIAHHRYVSENDVENFERALSIVDDVHNAFLDRLGSGEI